MMTNRTIPIGEWREYPDGSKVFYLHRKLREQQQMDETPYLRLVYITTPTPDENILNLQMGEHFVRFRITRDQLYNLNGDIADAFIRGGSRRLPNGQLDLTLDGPHTEH